VGKQTIIAFRKLAVELSWHALADCQLVAAAMEPFMCLALITVQSDKRRKMRHTTWHCPCVGFLADHAAIRSRVPTTVCSPNRFATSQRKQELLLAKLSRSYSAAQSWTLRDLSVKCSGTSSGAASAPQPSDGSKTSGDSSGNLSSALDSAIVHWDETSSRLVDSATLPFVFLLLPQVPAALAWHDRGTFEKHGGIKYGYLMF
jgi:hypothetical protein